MPLQGHFQNRPAVKICGKSNIERLFEMGSQTLIGFFALSSSEGVSEQQALS